MKQALYAAALSLALTGLAHAQSATSGLSTAPGLNGESTGTVTGSGAGRDGAFGSPTDSPRSVGARRGSTDVDAKGSSPGKGSAGAGRGTGTGSDKRGSASGGADPR